MKRDVTVILSLIGFLTALGLAVAWDMPSTITSESPVRFHVLFWSIIACALRSGVLWFQTLSHAVLHAPKRKRLGWVMGHVFFGQIASYVYYFKTKPPS